MRKGETMSQEGILAMEKLDLVIKSCKHQGHVESCYNWIRNLTKNNRLTEKDIGAAYILLSSKERELDAVRTTYETLPYLKKNEERIKREEERKHLKLVKTNI